MDSSLARDRHFPDLCGHLPWVLSLAVLEFENWPEEASSASAEDWDRQGEIDDGSLLFYEGRPYCLN